MSIGPLAYWAPTAEIPLLQTSCGGALQAAAHERPQHPALVDAVADPAQRRRWSYAELLREAEQTARGLLTVFEPGEHVAVWGGNCPEWVILQYGLALAGLVMVTINPASRVDELAYVLRQSRACGVFHQTTWRGIDMRGAIDAAVAREALGLRHIGSLEALREFAARGAADTMLPPVDPHQACMIQYTSGTTGRPKGALLNHYSVSNNARIMAVIKQQGPHTVNLGVAPLFHTGGCVGNVLGTVQTGGTLLLPAAFDAELMLDLIEQERVTYSFGVPTMLIALLAAQARQPRDVSSLRILFSGATIVPVEVVRQVEAVFGVTLIIGYGQTETSPSITHTRPGDSARDKSETIGQPIPHVEVKIVDPATGTTLPVDHPGELCTRGFHVMMGYHDMPDATASTIDVEGWLHTGDLCEMDARGFCRVTGRLKDLIIRGGENIYPREIEELLYAHPAVAEVAVFGVPDSYWGEQVGAALVFKAGQHASAAELADWVTARLARFKQPTRWYALTAIPATVSGKQQKFMLVEMWRTGVLAGSELG